MGNAADACGLRGYHFSIIFQEPEDHFPDQSKKSSVNQLEIFRP
jgi:hypothetical protein